MIPCFAIDVLFLTSNVELRFHLTVIKQLVEKIPYLHQDRVIQLLQLVMLFNSQLSQYFYVSFYILYTHSHSRVLCVKVFARAFLRYCYLSLSTSHLLHVPNTLQKRIKFMPFSKTTSERHKNHSPYRK